MLIPKPTANDSEQTNANKLRSIFSSLRLRLFLLVILAGIPAFCLILSTYLEDRQKKLADAQEDILNLTQIAFEKEQKLLELGRQLLVALAKLPQIRNFNAKACNDLLADLKKEYSLYSNLGVVDLKGNVSCSTITLNRKINLADRPWFRSVLQTKDFWVGNYQISRITKQPNLMLSYPVRDKQNKLSQVVFIGIDLRHLSQLAVLDRLPVGATYTIVDRNGIILVRYPNSEKWIGRSAPEARIIKAILKQKGRGIFETAGLDSIRRLYAFLPVSTQKVTPPFPPQVGRLTGTKEGQGYSIPNSQAAIYVTVGIPKKIVFASANRALTRNLVCLGLVSALGLAAAWIGSDLFIVRSVKSLVFAAKQVLDSDPTIRTNLKGRGVLRQLNLVFEAMAVSLERSLRERDEAIATLREKEKKYRSIVNSLREVIFQSDASGNWTFLNPAWCDITGFTIAESIGKNFLEFIYSGDRQRSLKELELLIQRQKNYCLSEVRYLTKNGDYRWLEAHFQPTFTPDGMIAGTCGTLKDISDRKLAKEALQKSEQRFRSVIENSSDIIFIVDRNRVYHYVSPSLERILGYAPQELLDKNGFDFIHPEDIPLVLAGFDRALQNPRISQQIIDYRFRHRNGSWRILEASITNLLDDPAIEGLVGNCHDITDRKLAEEALRESERRYHTLAKLSPVGIFRTDATGKCLYVNERWCEMSGLSLEDGLIDGWVQALHPEDRERVFLLWYQATKENWPFQSEYRFQRPDGAIIWVFSQANAEIGPNGEIIGYVGTIVDITKRKQTEELLRHYAFYDPLTGLPNRTLFLEQTKQTIAKAKRDEAGLFAVLLLDLNRFQIVKSSLGHLVADRLLIDTSERISSCLDLSDVAARVGLDEFAILLADLQEHTHATWIAERIYQELCVPFILEGQEIFITASVGIALSTIGYERAEDFLRAADMAMHQAKKQGKAGYAVFEPGWRDGAVERLQLEADLRRAIERQELRVFYQPIVSLQNGNIIGFEALVRWQHPTRGMVSPVNFIPLAEETGLIGQIDRWVMREACRQMAVWQHEFPHKKPLTISVNLSGFQLAQIGLIERVDQILRETGIERESLKLEITESSLLGNPSSEKAILEQLKGLDIQLLIDDFGTGYSSLARLHQLPIDTLKIDRSFVNQMTFDSESLEIVRTIISLAHILEMDVIAEGVETADQLAKLRELQCEYAQGYFMSKPVDSQAAGNLLANNLIF